MGKCKHDLKAEVKAFGRQVRLLVAIELASLDYLDSTQLNFLRAVAKADPVVRKVLETYQVTVPA